MIEDTDLRNDERVSDLLLDAIDEAYARWIAAVGDDIGGIAWDILTEDAYSGDLTAHDWTRLVDIGEDRVRAGLEMPPEMRESYEQDRVFQSALIGLTTVMTDRYDREHPESLEEMEAEIAQIEADTARIEAHTAQLNSEAETDHEFERETARIEAYAAQLNAEADRIDAHTAQLNAEVDRLERRSGLFSGWTTRLWRRKQVAPGVRVNLSKSGPSLTLGPKGGHVTYGPKGTTETVGLPGTGVWLQRRKPKD